MPDNHIDNKEHTAATELRRELAASGFTWALLTSLLLLASLSFYHIYYHAEAIDSSLSRMAAATTLFIAASITYYISRTSKREFLLWHICIALLTSCWLVSSFDIYISWYDSNSAEATLLIAFFVFLLGFHTQTSILALSLPFLAAGDTYYLVIGEDYNGTIDWVSSLAFYVVIYIFFRQTIGSFYQQSKGKYIENIRLIERLKEVSVTDELTGIGNRKAFNEWIQMSIDLTRRQKSSLSLVILDIDYFKQYNDAYGHPSGDRCIKQVAQLLAEKCRRQSDCVCRIGGEEFALILVDSSAAQSAQLVQGIMDELEKANIIHPDSDIADHLTLSFGIAEYHEQGVEELYRQADQALYNAKHGGRNQYAIAC